MSGGVAHPPFGPAGTRQAVLSVAEMERADAAAAAKGDGSYALMEAAGAAFAAALREALPDRRRFSVLCGPGNNGGDGYVIARLLRTGGAEVAVWSLADAATPDAGKARALFEGPVMPLSEFRPDLGEVVVDALFGAGLSRPLGGAALAACRAVNASGSMVAAVDLPSGIAGDTGAPLGECFRAAVTITFVRRKPAHLLFPGRRLCGRVVVADIGIGEDVIAEVGPRLFENGPGLWRERLPWPAPDTHKYARGALAVCSGPAGMTGAARLCAAAGARAGAGAVTVLSPAAAMAVNAAHLTAVMLREVETVGGLRAFLDKARVRAVALGPGFGDLEKARAFALAVLGQEPGEGEERARLVLDADGITAFRDNPAALFGAAAGEAPRLVLTPHEGEFARLFPDIAEELEASKVEKARRAAARAGAVVVLKGADTVVAAPDGSAVINGNATPFLATAGSGDVLAGLCGGLLAQGMPAFDAACAAVWVHAEAGRRFGPGLTADDLPDALLPVLRDLAPSELL